MSWTVAYTSTEQSAQDITSAVTLQLDTTTDYVEQSLYPELRLAIELNGLDTGALRTITVQPWLQDDGDTYFYYLPAQTYVISAYGAEMGYILTEPITALAPLMEDTATRLMVSILSNNSADTAVDVQVRVLGDTSVTGAGDTAVTVTIRETDTTPIADAQVWVNTANDRTSAVAGAQYTNASGLVSFNLQLGATYYVFCSKVGFEFATAGNTISPVSGTVAFTLDIGTAVTVGETSYYGESFLSRGIAEVRLNLDEPGLNEKYTDAQLISKLEQSYTTVIGEVNRNAETPIVATYDITVVSGTALYALPHHIGSIHAIYEESTSGFRVFYRSDSVLNTAGRGVWIEGHTLHIQPGVVTAGTVLTVEYVPSGTAKLHVGQGDAATIISTDKDTITLASSPEVGSLDRYENAYVGSVLRILYNTAGYINEERTITAYDVTTRIATLDLPLSGTYSSGTVYYEIGPAILEGLDHSISLYASMWIASVEGHTTRASQLRKMYANAIRTVRLHAYYSKLDESSRLKRDGYDSRRHNRKG